MGLRGVGKTVLLNKIREMAEGAGYRAVLIEAHEGKPLAALLLPSLRQLMIALDRMANISQKAKRGLRVLKSFCAATTAGRARPRSKAPPARARGSASASWRWWTMRSARLKMPTA